MSAPASTSRFGFHLKRHQRLVATFNFADADGVILYRKHRIEPGEDGRSKTFRLDQADGTGRWKPGASDIRVPYRLPDIARASPTEPIIMTEGEAKADKFAAWGYLASSYKDWKEHEFSEHVVGRIAYLVPDNDEPGRKQAENARKMIERSGGKAIIVELPSLIDGGDILDWSGGAEDFAALIAAAERNKSEPSATSTKASADGPEPFDLWAHFSPPELPAGLLPRVIEEWATAIGTHMGADPAGLAMAAVATFAAAIPDHVFVVVKRNGDWRESARVWVALIGPPSTKKSPIISSATSPLCYIDMRRMKHWAEQCEHFDALEPAEKKGKKRPAQTRLRIEDATVEAAQQVLEGSPWGVLLLQDELAGFFGAMDKYGGGGGASANRAFWLRAYNGGEYAVNRVSRGAVLIPNLSISMLGGIQPEPLRKVAHESVDDGLLQRLLPITLKPATLGRDETLPPVVNEYRNIVIRLHKLGATQLRFDPKAQVIRQNVEARYLKLQSLETVNGKLAAHIGKYEGLFARLCIVWHCTEHVMARSGSPLPTLIPEAIATRVADFMYRFLLAHAVNFYLGALGLSDDHDRLTAIADYILAHKLSRITNREIARGDRTLRSLRDFQIRPLMEQMEALGWVERADAPRPSQAPHWLVNPIVHQKFAERGAKEARRRKQAKEALAEVFSQRG